jgi:hypothetical protein
VTLLAARAVLAARADLLRAIDGFDDARAALRVAGLNEPAWMVAHLAEQEQRYWLKAFGKPAVVAELAGYRRARPDVVLPLSAALSAWRTVADATTGVLLGFEEGGAEAFPPERSYVPAEPIAVLCLRVFGHYYLHVGQLTAVRRTLGMPVPTFVGKLPGGEAP